MSHSNSKESPAFRRGESSRHASYQEEAEIVAEAEKRTLDVFTVKLGPTARDGTRRHRIVLRKRRMPISAHARTSSSATALANASEVFRAAVQIICQEG